ncbi:MAG: phosphoribosylglycinamide formyltransferase [Clostridia bacterium]|nr:phosphoribosylglycinamide formyltransferase [Clostridia bacterium]MDE6758513.1 phosphoribosylglycinamide formyltransferase [Clostridia bacterium]MDE7079515.1 phosphoribosylglycinamide formyltransferase [Clostridia bacterium]
MKNIAIFASGSGSDMQSVVDATLSGQIDGRVAALVANKEGIFAIERAKTHGIDYKTFLLGEYENNEARDKAIVEYLKPYNIDLIVLAGYLAIVTPILVDEYKDRIINIHPSLIPKHCGIGMYGLNVHRSVIASGDKVSGCTVHFVDYGADTGKIIEQVEVPVKDGDTPETLQARVLEQEHKLLPSVVARLCKK